MANLLLTKSSDVYFWDDWTQLMPTVLNSENSLIKNKNLTLYSVQICLEVVEVGC